jgi:hypothetical protein
MRDGIQHKKSEARQVVETAGLRVYRLSVELAPYGQVTVRWNGESVGVTPVLSKVCT